MKKFPSSATGRTVPTQASESTVIFEHWQPEARSVSASMQFNAAREGVKHECMSVARKSVSSVWESGGPSQAWNISALIQQGKGY